MRVLLFVTLNSHTTPLEEVQYSPSIQAREHSEAAAMCPPHNVMVKGGHMEFGPLRLHLNAVVASQIATNRRFKTTSPWKHSEPSRGI